MIKNRYIEVLVFVCGAVVMIFELVGSRILAPFIGTSTFVWTSLIGVILLSLSIGYWLGGRLADKKTSIDVLFLAVLWAAICICITTLLKEHILIFLTTRFVDIRISSLIASLLLFSPTSILLGIVSPYATRLKINQINTSGKVIGNIYSFSTLGSIVGTFLAGYFLIPQFGSVEVLFSLSVVLFITAVLLKITFKKSIGNKSMPLVTVSIISLSGFQLWSNQTPELIDVDTAYNRVLVYNTIHQKSRKPIKVMRINNQVNSSMYLNNDSLVHAYTKKYLELSKELNSAPKRILVLGGAAYSLPKALQKAYSNTDIDVVEIDKGLTQLAKKHFRLNPTQRLKIYHEDGRTFINMTNKIYDLVFWDVFKSNDSAPYQLATLEVAKRLKEILTTNGTILINNLSSLAGRKSLFLQAEFNTYQEVFKSVELIPVHDKNDQLRIQNVILIARNEKIPFLTTADFTSGFNSNLVLTDNYSPVNWLLNQ